MSTLRPPRQKTPGAGGRPGERRSLNYGGNRVFILPVRQCFRVPHWCPQMLAGLDGDVRAGVKAYSSMKRWAKLEGLRDE